MQLILREFSLGPGLFDTLRTVGYCWPHWTRVPPASCSSSSSTSKIARVINPLLKGALTFAAFLIGVGGSGVVILHHLVALLLLGRRRAALARQKLNNPKTASNISILNSYFLERELVVRSQRARRWEPDLELHVEVPVIQRVPVEGHPLSLDRESLLCEAVRRWLNE